MDNNNYKPLTIAREDYINNLVDLTNKSQLPLLVVEYVLRDFLNQVHVANQQQTVVDKQEYEKGYYKTEDGD